MSSTTSTNEHQLKYPDNWDCSRAYQRYSAAELSIIRRMKQQGFSNAAIAQRLHRGEWAIEVVIMKERQAREQRRTLQQRNINRVVNTPCSRQRVFKKKAKKLVVAQPKQATGEEVRKVFNVKKVHARNRKFGARKQLVATATNEMQDHLKDLLGI